MIPLGEQQDIFLDGLILTGTGKHLPQKLLHHLRCTLLEVTPRLILPIIDLSEILTEDIMRRLGAHGLDPVIGEILSRSLEYTMR